MAPVLSHLTHTVVHPPPFGRLARPGHPFPARPPSPKHRRNSRPHSAAEGLPVTGTTCISCQCRFPRPCKLCIISLQTSDASPQPSHRPAKAPSPRPWCGLWNCFHPLLSRPPAICSPSNRAAVATRRSSTSQPATK